MSQWIQDHQALLLLAWPALTAIFSLVYTQLDKMPRVHAFFSVLASLGIDLPKLFDALGRLFTGGKVPPSTGGTVTQLPKPMTPQAKDSVPPTMRMVQIRRRAMRLFAPMAVMGALATCMTGCAAFQSFLDNPVTVARSLSEYVVSFLQAAQTVWALIQPLLGSNATQANALFNDAVVSAQNANALLQDAAQTVAAGKSPTPDLTALSAALNDAVQRVWAVILQFRQPTAGIGEKADNVGHMAAQIAHWVGK